jgi:hypothetical protein
LLEKTRTLASHCREKQHFSRFQTGAASPNSTSDESKLHRLGAVLARAHSDSIQLGWISRQKIVMQARDGLEIERAGSLEIERAGSLTTIASSSPPPACRCRRESCLFDEPENCEGATETGASDGGPDVQEK